MTQLNFISLWNFLRAVCFFMLSFLSSTPSFATHASGADLTYICLGSNQYQLSLIVYRDCNGINLPSNQSINWSGACGSGTVSAARTSIVDITPLPSFAQSSCATGNPGLGREAHSYSAIITLPSGCTSILFSYRLCCRVASATTVIGQGALYIDAFLDSVGSCNNTPIFLNHPLFFNCVNNPILHNPGVVDLDGDSLVFSLVDIQDNNSSIINYLPGYDGLNFLGPNVPINIDPATGVLTFTPTNTEVAYACIRVDEYRNGVHIGYIKRDILYHIVTCTNNPPILSGVDSTTVDSVSVCAGSQICFDIYAVDANLTDSIILSLNSTLPNSSFTTYSGATDNLMMGTFCWTPTLADTGLHQINILANDYSFPFCGHSYRTYQIYVHPNPNDLVDVGPDLNICEGDSIILTAATSSQSVLSYEWTSTTGTIISPDSFSTTVVSPSSSTYQILTTYSDGCSYLDSVMVHVNLITLTMININDATSLFPPNGSATVQAQGGTGGYTYNWDANTGNQTTATATNLTPYTYCVLVADSLGCSDTACVFIPFYSSVQLASSAKEILLFPNPAQKEVFIDCSTLMGSKRIKIYDVVGQLVYSNTTSDKQASISVKNWMEGVYVLKLTTENEEQFNKKIIVRR